MDVFLVLLHVYIILIVKQVVYYVSYNVYYCVTKQAEVLRFL